MNTKPIEISWLNKLHEVSERLYRTADVLEEKARAFYALGMFELSDLFKLEAELCRKSCADISSATGTVTSLLLHGAQEASFNMLKATLAGIEIGVRDKKTGVESGTDEHVARGLLPPQER